MPTEFQLPDLGENIEGGDVISVLVKEGDVLSTDQPVIELETDKAVIEIPSSVSGRIKEILVKEGGRASVGQPILTVDADSVPAPEAESEPVDAPRRARQSSRQQRRERSRRQQGASRSRRLQDRPSPCPLRANRSRQPLRCGVWQGRSG